MQQSIQSYLAQHRTLQLAPFGELSLIEKSLGWLAVEGELQHNGYELSLVPNTQPTSSAFINYVVNNSSFTEDEVASRIQELSNSNAIQLPVFGVSINKSGVDYSVNGNLSFNNTLLPVAAPKVIRKEQTHSIRVGEDQRTNAEMQAYYAEDVVEKKSGKWWIAALILGMGAIGYAVYYFIVQKGSF